ncbi:CBO0543 family protein [Paenibacillus sp. NPDC056579]|uniref:CBO0543 family protein n=1 Tax=Paenibacillus sp. NPDC056579 TaxID=3345871 RepID=UPI0036B33988
MEPPYTFPADITVFPVSFMVVYQFFKTWKSYLLASIFLAALFCYVNEPLFVLGNMFQMNNWTHTHSFIGFCFSILSRWIVLKFLSMSKQN